MSAAKQHQQPQNPTHHAVQWTVYHHDGSTYTGDPVDCKEMIAMGAWFKDPEAAQAKAAEVAAAKQAVKAEDPAAPATSSKVK